MIDPLPEPAAGTSIDSRARPFVIVKPTISTLSAPVPRAKITRPMRPPSSVVTAAPDFETSTTLFATTRFSK